jgi:iron complex transport system substrate-binding protein
MYSHRSYLKPYHSKSRSPSGSWLNMRARQLLPSMVKVARTEAISAKIILILLAVSLASATEVRTITDAAGREVMVPKQIERVYAAGPPASVLVYAVAPNKLLGWTRSMTPDEARFLPEQYVQLPTLGRLTGRGNTANMEVILRAQPDLILDSGSVAPTFVSLANRVQAQIGIPYVLLDGRFASLGTSLRTVGMLLDQEEHGRRLADYVDQTVAEVQTRIASVPEEARPRVYYARGPNGLQTALPGAINVETIEFIGGRNVVRTPDAPGRLINVSLEQVLLWNPEVIVTVDPHFYATVWNDPRWEGVQAVREKRVYLSPYLPFGWVDLPPGVNRVIGLRWLAAVLYPHLFREDLQQQTVEFFRLFYHTELTPDQLDALLSPTTGIQR